MCIFCVFCWCDKKPYIKYHNHTCSGICRGIWLVCTGNSIGYKIMEIDQKLSYTIRKTSIDLYFNCFSTVFSRNLSKKTILNMIIRNYFKLLLTNIENSEVATGCVVLKKVFWKNLAKFKGKHLCHFLFCALLATLLKKRIWHRYFPMNFAKFLRPLSCQNNSGRMFPKIWTFKLNFAFLCFFWNSWYFQCVHHRINNIPNYCLQSEMG